MRTISYVKTNHHCHHQHRHEDFCFAKHGLKPDKLTVKEYFKRAFTNEKGLIMAGN